MRWVLAAPFLLLLVLFALSNRAPVTLGLWPTGLGIEAPLALVILATAAIAFLAGALVMWIGGLGHRRRARRAEARLRKLEEAEAARVAIVPPSSGSPGIALAPPGPGRG